VSKFQWQQYFISARHGRKLRDCRWNFDAVYHSSRDISISGLGGHIAISGCRSLLLSFGNTFFDVAVVGKLDFKHDHKISPVSKKFTRVWRHAKQLLVHRLTIWLLHFVHTSYSGKVTKGQRPTLNRNFLLIQKLSWVFYPQAQYEG